MVGSDIRCSAIARIKPPLVKLLLTMKCLQPQAAQRSYVESKRSPPKTAHSWWMEGGGRSPRK
ncbi:MAG: hypothetical protein ACFB12_02965 [Leptolyngbyaceae cyanobacterium]